MAADAIALAGRSRLAPVPATAEVIDRFRAALVARDIVPPESIIADGSIHRCDAAGKNGKGDAAYLLHLDGIPAGGLENWRDGKGWESWRFDIGRALTPAELDLSPQARAEWIRFHDAVERELGARGALRGVRNVAAKAAENAARLAALFHVLEHGASGTIASGKIRAAACIVGWHLNGTRRLLADLDAPPSLAAAIRLDAWLRNEALANGTDRVPTKRIY